MPTFIHSVSRCWRNLCKCVGTFYTDKNLPIAIWSVLSLTNYQNVLLNDWNCKYSTQQSTINNQIRFNGKSSGPNNRTLNKHCGYSFIGRDHSYSGIDYVPHWVSLSTASIATKVFLESVLSIHWGLLHAHLTLGQVMLFANISSPAYCICIFSCDQVADFSELISLYVETNGDISLPQNLQLETVRNSYFKFWCGSMWDMLLAALRFKKVLNIDRQY